LTTANNALAESNAQVGALAGSNGSAAMTSGDAAALVAANAHADAGDATTLAAANAHTDTTAVTTLASANNYTDSKVQALTLDFTGLNGRVDDLENKVGVLDDRVNRVGAMGAAMAQMSAAGASNGNNSRVSAGVGYYGGRSAFAVGFQATVTPHTTLTFGTAYDGDKAAAGAGVSYGW
jgi:hypothetical protein